MYKHKRDETEPTENTTHDLDSGPKGNRDAELAGQRRELLNLVTQETRFEIIQNIVGHPAQLPTLKELDYFMPGVSKSTIRNHLERLVKRGVVEQVELPKDDRTRDLPHVFYGLTEEGREILETADLLRAERSLQETTMKTQLTPGVEKYMEAPRPEWIPARPIDTEELE
ncbi:helix-turn-helix domain-containing protein [Natronococcus roseus]|uniref:helix-turn-helix domain-containing protein n=1 Tax=Natronococcus roseus TaxID=1052014 RepID=UPI00374D1018